MKSFLTTIGAGRLIGVALTISIAIGALVAVPLLASADEEPAPAERTRDVTVFQQGLNELRIEGFLNRAAEVQGGLTFEFGSDRLQPGVMATDLIETIADLTGTSTDDVVSALADGQSLTEFAEEHGVNEDALLDGLMAAINVKLDEAVDDGDLTEEQAARFRTEISEHLQDLINGDWPAEGFGFERIRPIEPPFQGDHGFKFDLDLNPVEITADLTGTDSSEVHDALRNGQTLVEFAADHGVGEEELVNAIMTSVEEKAAEAVSAGDLTQDDADQIIANLEEHVRATINGEGFGFGRGPGFGRGGHFGPFGGGQFVPHGCDDDGEQDGESTSSQI